MRKLFVYFAVLAGSAIVYSICWAAAPAMVEKNLFSQDRKAPSPEQAAIPSQPSKPGMPITNLQLDGVMIQGDSRKALVRMKSQAGGATHKKGAPPYVTVRENQQVGDFKVAKIEAKSISLEKDGQTFVLGLYAEGKVVIPAAVVQPAPGPGAGMPVHPGRPREAGQAPQPLQPGVQGQPGVVNMPDPGIIDPSLPQVPPQVVAITGQPGEPDVPAPDQGIPPEEEPQ